MSEPTFTTDWFTDRTPAWLKHVVPRISRVPGARWLEVGSYEGRSALWTLHNVLLAPNSTITCVDKFDESGYARRFYDNTRNETRLTSLRGLSHDCLVRLRGKKFHGAYVDDDHTEEGAYRTALLAWPLMLPGAVVVFDDYDNRQEWAGVRRGVDQFLAVPEVKFEVLHQGYQLIVLKKPS